MAPPTIMPVKSDSVRMDSWLDPWLSDKPEPEPEPELELESESEPESEIEPESMSEPEPEPEPFPELESGAEPGSTLFCGGCDAELLNVAMLAVTSVSIP